MLSAPQTGRAITLEEIPQPVVMPALAAGAKPQPVSIARLIMSVPQGYKWGTAVPFKFMSGCSLEHFVKDGLVWRGKSGDLPKNQYEFLFAEELKAAGFSAANDPENLFQENRGSADLAVAGNIKGMDAAVCIREAREPMNHTLDPDKLTGGIAFTIDWQVYSRGRKTVVLEKSVKSGFFLTKHEAGNLNKLINGGMRENMRALIASEDFRKIVLAAPEPKSVQTASKPAAITLTGALKAGAMKIPDAVGSVVLIQSGGGHGSGFLVSSDGYLLTAAHVVGADKYVKIRWSDGLEGVGEVVRTDKRRDAALIKADARGRRPLAMRRASPEQGDAVFTIGAPIDPKLQSTVTRGVVSANRIMDGFSFIQSDVTVDPGNSGGPLLNEKGEVLGFTDKGLRSSEAPTGLNFFVPIDDALRFLSLEPG
jgi:S1-C subfamily serine protease